MPGHRRQKSWEKKSSPNLEILKNYTPNLGGGWSDTEKYAPGQGGGIILFCPGRHL